MTKNAWKKVPKTKFMPHNYPNSESINLGPNQQKPPCKQENKETPAEPVKMNAAKENYRNSHLSGDDHALSIPAHIHDVSGKTFYKLGNFLGKVE